MLRTFNNILVIIVWFLMLATAVFAEKNEPLTLNHADGFEYINRGGVRIQKLTGKVSITYQGLDIKADTVLNDATAGRLEFFNKVTLVDTTDRFMKANRLVYYKNEHTAEAKGAIQVVDSSDKMVLTGDEGRYWKHGRITRITVNPMIIKTDSSSDTLRIVSKTMEHFGTDRKSLAMKNVTIRQGKMTAFCERAEYLHKEGVISLFDKPYVIYEGDKIAGDTIHILLDNDTIREFKAIGKANARFSDSTNITLMNADTLTAYLSKGKVKNATLLGRAKTASYQDGDSLKTNTLSARRIMFFLEGNTVDSMHAFQNATAFYVHDEDGSEKGRNETSGDSLYFHFRKRKLDRIFARGSIRGTYLGK